MTVTLLAAQRWALLRKCSDGRFQILAMHPGTGRRRSSRARRRYARGDEPSTSRKVPVRRLAERVAEAADEVRARETRRGRQGPDVQWTGVVAVHRVAGTQEDPVGDVS